MSEKYSEFCAKNFPKMQGFMEVCLLVLLHQETNHGYGLIEHLQNFGFTSENLNMSTLYKTLRRMEDDNLVKSSWQSGSQGPKKRVYHITDAGKMELEHWIKFLKLRQARISQVIARYDEHMISTSK